MHNLVSTQQKFSEIDHLLKNKTRLNEFKVIKIIKIMLPKF